MRLADILGLQRVQPISHGKALRIAKKAPLFRSMSHNALSSLLDESTQTIYDAGAVIIRQGERDDTVYMVLSGSVRVVYSDSQTEVSVAELGPGEVFGELAALQTQPRSANVVTLERTNCLQVSAAVFMAALK
jgi:CRP/FNR family transcriptional regulator, cyclic AMP receptor protein